MQHSKILQKSLQLYFSAIMEKNLPIYNAEINSEMDGIFAISLVDWPATQSNFVYFNEDKAVQKFSIQDEEQRIVSGVVMLADTPIYRRDADGTEYYLLFSEETIRLMAEKMLKDNTQNQVDLYHNGELIGAVNLLELFIKDSKKGIVPNYLEDVPDGSLVATYKVRDDEVWEAIKSGKLRGFSLAGIFDITKDDSEKDLQEILSQLKKLRKIK